jgi:hypothetical protein
MFTDVTSILSKILHEFGEDVVFGNPRRFRSIFQDFSLGDYAGHLEILSKILSEIPDLRNKIQSFTNNDISFFTQRIADKYFYKEDIVSLAICSLINALSPSANKFDVSKPSTSSSIIEPQSILKNQQYNALKKQKEKVSVAKKLSEELINSRKISRDVAIAYVNMKYGVDLPTDENILNIAVEYIDNPNP